MGPVGVFWPTARLGVRVFRIATSAVLVVHARGGAPRVTAVVILDVRTTTAFDVRTTENGVRAGRYLTYVSRVTGHGVHAHRVAAAAARGIHLIHLGVHVLRVPVAA